MASKLIRPIQKIIRPVQKIQQLGHLDLYNPRLDTFDDLANRYGDFIKNRFRSINRHSDSIAQYGFKKDGTELVNVFSRPYDLYGLAFENRHGLFHPLPYGVAYPPGFLDNTILSYKNLDSSIDELANTTVDTVWESRNSFFNVMLNVNEPGRYVWISDFLEALFRGEKFALMKDHPFMKILIHGWGDASNMLYLHEQTGDKLLNAPADNLYTHHNYDIRKLKFYEVLNECVALRCFFNPKRELDIRSRCPSKLRTLLESNTGFA